MMTVDDIFRNRKVRFDRLIPYGFAKKGGNYVYSKRIGKGQFELVVTVNPKGKTTTTVIDTRSQEPYVLHQVRGATGAFVGNIRQDYAAILASISEACFESDVFKSKYARTIIEYVRETYNDELQFLWKKFPYNAILRRQDNKKWYAALLVVKKSKIGFKEDDDIEIIDLRVKPEELPKLVDNKKYFPGYHMNKKHWVTARLDGSVSVKELARRIDDSFAIAKKS